MNHIKTAFLFTAIVVLFMMVGKLIGGNQGMFVALMFAFGINFFSYWFSDKIVLRMYSAREAGSNLFPEVHRIVRTLALSAGIPTPKVFVIDQPAPNAFATGRNPDNAVVAVTKGLVKNLNEEELTGVIAHELAHIANRDILIGTVVASVAGAIMMLSTMARWSAIFGGFRGSDDDNGGSGILGLIVMSIIAPLAAVLIQMAISRSREYLADSTGAKIARQPRGLANALKKLDAYSSRVQLPSNPSTAHMFIVNPLTGKNNFQNLFSTHPPIEERVRRLVGGISESNRTRKKGTESSESLENSGKKFWDHLNNR